MSSYTSSISGQSLRRQRLTATATMRTSAVVTGDVTRRRMITHLTSKKRRFRRTITPKPAFMSCHLIVSQQQVIPTATAFFPFDSFSAEFRSAIDRASALGSARGSDQSSRLASLEERWNRDGSNIESIDTFNDICNNSWTRDQLFPPDSHI